KNAGRQQMPAASANSVPMSLAYPVKSANKMASLRTFAQTGCKAALSLLFVASVLVSASGVPSGSVWGWGSDITSYIPLSASNAIAVSAGYSHGLALLRNGTVIGFGTDYYG